VRHLGDRRWVFRVGAVAAAAILSLSGEAFAQTFTTTGSIPSGFSISAVVRVGNGKVLALGEGQEANLQYPPESALYDPATKAWSPAAPLPDRAAGFTATTLTNGKVLVAGGSTQPVPDTGVATVPTNTQLFDPATNTWSTGGAMVTPRSGHTATLLQNGKVLVTGGSAPGSAGFLTSAELYDPSTNTWSSAAPLAVARFLAKAVLLANGKVLVVGGEGLPGPIYFQDAELYDPVANSWSPAGQLSAAPAFSNSLTLLPNGKVLNVGISNELYDPATNAWSPAAPPLQPRGGQIAALLPSGRVLIAGGVGSGQTTLASAELYDPSSNSWSATGSLASPRQNHFAVSLANGDVLVVGGGTSSSTVLFTTEVYSSSPPLVPAAPTWALVALVVALGVVSRAKKAPPAPL
jgi:N-acetylneuraminic acid mutarotase